MAPPEAAHVGPDALADRLQRRPAIALLRHVPADDVRSAVVDGPEEPAPALRSRPEPRRVRTPELVRPLRLDPLGRKADLHFPVALAQARTLLQHRLGVAPVHVSLAGSFER